MKYRLVFLEEFHSYKNKPLHRNQFYRRSYLDRIFTNEFNLSLLLESWRKHSQKDAHKFIIPHNNALKMTNQTMNM